MLEFPEDFFQAEVREDFSVDETMKTVWAAEMEVLNEIAVICSRHNLQWYAAYGTLLGAVRHEGYIPWDDDMDIMMKRGDYMKLLEVMPGELPEGFRIHCPLYGTGSDSYQCMVENSDSISIEPEHLRRFHGCPFKVGVDIFPLDYVPRDSGKLEEQRNRFLLVRQTIWLIKFGEDTPQNREQIELGLASIKKMYGIQLKRTGGKKDDTEIISRLWRLSNQIAMTYGEEDGDELAMYVNLAKSENMRFDRRWFDEVEYLPFEQVMLPVPKEYDSVLRTIYGDYTVPVKLTQLHDYPGYIKQLEELRRLYAANQAVILGEPMRRAVEQDKEAILAYLKKEVADCLYMYIDILNYGIASDNMTVWFQEQDGQIELVVMKYYDSFQLYSHKRGIDVAPILELMREHPVRMISARRDIIEQLASVCGDYSAAYGSVFDVSHPRLVVAVDVPAKADTYAEAGEEEAIGAVLAAEADAKEIAELICTNASFDANYNVDNLAAQLAERIRTHTGRSAVIRIDGRIVAHVATYAEAEGIAVMSGLIVLPEYRNYGFIDILSAYLGGQLGKEGKTMYSFAISRKTIRYHRALFAECGEYGKLVKMRG